MKTLIQTILPRIALYKVLLNEEFSKEDVYQYMRKYMIDKIAAKKHASTAKMELVPGFYKIYSFIFLKIMRTTDLQENTQSYGKDHYDVTITKCLCVSLVPALNSPTTGINVEALYVLRTCLYVNFKLPFSLKSIS